MPTMTSGLSATITITIATNADTHPSAGSKVAG
jgi:hypothetical protein